MTIHDMFQAAHRINDPTNDRCDDCQHSFHSLPCKAAACLCPTAFVDKYATEETA